jgi:cyclopropane-fatty-acyl-phospholipid synthase
MQTSIELAERGMVPDLLVRAGIRRLLRRRLAEEAARASVGDAVGEWARSLADAPIALATGDANAQHYEVPAAFFAAVLGPQMKYSSCHWDGAADLAAAEEEMFVVTASRARLADGQRVLELGCGWGSLTLWMARRFPRSRIVAVSNSRTQREFILGRARREGLGNVSVVTADMNDFAADGRFDRVVSVEMFEHMRNWTRLLTRIRDWLTPDGRLFLHFFAHRRFAYAFGTDRGDDWMGRHFFTGGMMPSADLLARLEIPFDVARSWDVNGAHYARTAEAWLANLDARADEVTALFARDVGPDAARRTVQRWRIFFLSCAELFGFRGGDEWIVVHALLAPRGAAER